MCRPRCEQQASERAASFWDKGCRFESSQVMGDDRACFQRGAHNFAHLLLFILYETVQNISKRQKCFTNKTAHFLRLKRKTRNFCWTFRGFRTKTVQLEQMGAADVLLSSCSSALSLLNSNGSRWRFATEQRAGTQFDFRTRITRHIPSLREVMPLTEGCTTLRRHWCNGKFWPFVNSNENLTGALCHIVFKHVRTTYINRHF